MSNDTYQPRQDYLGTGSVDEYTFDFLITAKEHLFVLVTDATYTTIFDGRGDDTVFLADVTFDPVLGGGTVTLVDPLPAGYHLTFLQANDSPTQDYEFKQKGDFLLATFTRALDALMAMVQRLAYLGKRSVKLSDNFQDIDTFDLHLPINTVDVANAGKTLILNDTGDGFKLGPSAADLAASGGLPAGGDAYALLEKVSATDNDATWTAPLEYSGYTERFAETINLQGVKAVMDYIMDMGYAPPTLSLTGSVSTAAREIGNAIASVDLSAVVGKILDDIGVVRFYLNPSTLLDTQTSGPAIPNGGTNVYTYSTPFSTTTTFRAEVDDVSVQAKPSRTATLTYSFYYPYFSGKGGAAETPATIYSTFTKTIASTPASVAVSFSFLVGEKPYFAYPATFADLTSIKNVNNLETIGSWTKRTENMTNAYGQTTSYKIYEFNNLAGVANDNTYTFIR